MSRQPDRFQHSCGGQLHPHYQFSHFKHTLDSYNLSWLTVALQGTGGIITIKGNIQPIGAGISGYMSQTLAFREVELGGEKEK